MTIAKINETIFIRGHDKGRLYKDVQGDMIYTIRLRE